MRRREHERRLATQKAADQSIIDHLVRENDRLTIQNADLLNRCMAQDWSVYTALSAEPDDRPPLPDMLRDDTGLIEYPDDPAE